MIEIQRLLAETIAWRKEYAPRRDQHAPGTAQRRDFGLEALACAIRERAFREALAALRRAP